MTQQKRSNLIPVGLGLVLGLAVLGYITWSSDEPTTNQATVSEPPARKPPAPAASTNNAAPAKQRDPERQPDTTGDHNSARVADSELGNNDRAPIEPPDLNNAAQTPEPLPVTPESRGQQQRDAFSLLNRSIERLEAESRATEERGDTQLAERHRNRVERMRARLDAVKAALERPEADETVQ